MEAGGLTGSDRITGDNSRYHPIAQITPVKCPTCQEPAYHFCSRTQAEFTVQDIKLNTTPDPAIFTKPK